MRNPHSQELKLAATLVASIGFMGSVATGASASCPTDAIKKIEHNVADGRTFEHTAIRSKVAGDVIKAFSRKNPETRQFMIDPLTIKCGGKVVRYVGITNERARALGQSFKLGHDAATDKDVYMDVVKPADVTLQSMELGSDPGSVPELKNTTVRVNAHNTSDLAGVFPAFVQVGTEHQFGAMHG